MSNKIPSSIMLRVISPRRLVFHGEVAEVTIPGLDGYLGILPGHRPLFIALGEGELAFHREGRKRTISINGGYAEVTHRSVLVFINPGKHENEYSDKKR